MAAMRASRSTKRGPAGPVSKSRILNCGPACVSRHSRPCAGPSRASRSRNGCGYQCAWTSTAPVTRLEFLVRAVAEREFGAVLAAAKESGLVLVLDPDLRLEPRLGGVRAVAERLPLRQPARAPGVAVGCEELDLVGTLLRDDRFVWGVGHVLSGGLTGAFDCHYRSSARQG